MSAARTLTVVLALGLAASACARIQAPVPESFAAFEGGSSLRAVTPDGVVNRVHRVPNEPEADLDFWREALRVHMERSGYKVVADGDLESTPAGYWLELAAPMGTEDHTYVIGVVVDGKQLVVAESAGEVARFTAYRDAVLTAMAGVGSPR